MPCVCFPLFSSMIRRLKDSCSGCKSTSIPLYSDLLEPDALCPARGGHRVAAERQIFIFQRLKGSKLASLGVWSAVHSRHLASHVERSIVVIPSLSMFGC